MKDNRLKKNVLIVELKNIYEPNNLKLMGTEVSVCSKFIHVKISEENFLKFDLEIWSIKNVLALKKGNVKCKLIIETALLFEKMKGVVQ